MFRSIHNQVRGLSCSKSIVHNPRAVLDRGMFNTEPNAAESAPEFWRPALLGPIIALDLPR